MQNSVFKNFKEIKLTVNFPKGTSWTKLLGIFSVIWAFPSTAITKKHVLVILNPCQCHQKSFAESKITLIIFYD